MNKGILFLLVQSTMGKWRRESRMPVTWQEWTVSTFKNNAKQTFTITSPWKSQENVYFTVRLPLEYTKQNIH